MKFLSTFAATLACVKAFEEFAYPRLIQLSESEFKLLNEDEINELVSRNIKFMDVTTNPMIEQYASLGDLASATFAPPSLDLSHYFKEISKVNIENFIINLSNFHN